MEPPFHWFSSALCGYSQMFLQKLLILHQSHRSGYLGALEDKKKRAKRDVIPFGLKRMGGVCKHSLTASQQKSHYWSSSGFIFSCRGWRAAAVGICRKDADADRGWGGGGVSCTDGFYSYISAEITQIEEMWERKKKHRMLKINIFRENYLL